MYKGDLNVGKGISMIYRCSRVWLLLLGIWTVSFAGNASRFPFPHAGYRTVVSSLPQVTRDSLNRVILQKYSAFKKGYVELDTVQKNSFYIKSPTLLSGPKIAYTSAAVHCQSMLIFALMAGEECDSREIFDGLFSFYRHHKDSCNNGRMASYCCEKGDFYGQASFRAEMDLAYALILAHSQWGSDGAVSYRSEAKRVVQNLLLSNLIDPQTKRTRLPGEGETSGRSCSGDWAPAYFRTFFALTGDSLFLEAIDTLYTVHSEMSHGEKSGLAPAYVEGIPARAASSQSIINGGDFSEDGFLFPLQMALDYLHFGDVKAGRSCGKIWHWLTERYERDTLLPTAGYTLDGEALTNYSSLPSVASLASTALSGDSGGALLPALLSYLLQQEAIDAESHSLQLLSLLLLSGNWWSPAAALQSEDALSYTSPCAPKMYVAGNKIEALGLTGDNAFLSLYSLRGQLLYKKSVNIIKRTLTEELSYTTFSGGFALLQLEGEGYRLLEKINVSR